MKRTSQGPSVVGSQTACSPGPNHVTRRHCPDATSQSRRVESRDAESARAPSGEKAQAVTLRVCPYQVARVRPEATSQSRRGVRPAHPASAQDRRAHPRGGAAGGDGRRGLGAGAHAEPDRRREGGQPGVARVVGRGAALAGCCRTPPRCEAPLPAAARPARSASVGVGRARPSSAPVAERASRRDGRVSPPESAAPVPLAPLGLLQQPARARSRTSWALPGPAPRTAAERPWVRAGPRGCQPPWKAPRVAQRRSAKRSAEGPVPGFHVPAWRAASLSRSRPPGARRPRRGRRSRSPRVGWGRTGAGARRARPRAGRSRSA